jgi:hypothetical protein
VRFCGPSTRGRVGKANARCCQQGGAAPVASANSLFGLTRLSVWWLRLGIDLERIKPGRPQQNGRQIEEKIWLVSFMRYDLGFFDYQTCRIESAGNPFTAKVLPMSPGAGINRHLSHRNRHTIGVVAGA